MLDELRHTPARGRSRADGEAIRRAEPSALPERYGPPRSPSARTAQLPAVGFGGPEGYDLVQTPRRRPQVVALRVAGPRRQASGLDAAGQWIRALALRLAFTLTGRV